ncbi:MAG: hypothetical protein ACLPJH_00150 [Myxococcaceae bacterium]
MSLNERIQHLAAVDRESIGFDKRGQLLKLRAVRPLPDPHAAILEKLDPSFALEGVDVDYTAKVLEFLSYSEVMDASEFKDRYRETMRGIAQMARDLTDYARRRFPEVVVATSERLKTYYPTSPLDPPDEAYVCGACGPVSRPNWRDVNKTSEESLQRAAFWFERSYFGTSFVIDGAREYLRAIEMNGPSPTVDPNDAGDTSVCSHLSLDSRFIVVTEDARLLRSLNDAQDRLERLVAGGKLPGDASTWKRPRTMPTSELRALLLQL